jgi:tight adherence protein B
MTHPEEFLKEPEVLIFGGLIVVGLLVIIAALLAGDATSQRLKRRINQVKTGRKSNQKAGPSVNVRKRTSESNIAFFDQLIKSALPRREELRARLMRAGLDVTLGKYLTICGVCGVVVFGLLVATGMVPLIASVFMGIFGAIGLPYVFVSFLAKRRQSKFISLFPEAIDLMTRGIKSGLPISEAIKNAGEEIADPVGSEMRKVTDGVKMGNKLEDMLWESAAQLDLQEFKFFTVSLAIQSETGGNLAETLENLSNVLRGRRQLKLKIKALSSEAKASAYIIGSLPFVMAILIYLVNSNYIMDLFIDPRGHVLIGLGLASFVVGAVVMYRMVRFEI